MPSSGRTLTIKRFDAFWLSITVIWVFIDLIPQQNLVVAVKALLLLTMLRRWPNGISVIITLFLILFVTVNFFGTHWWMNAMRTAVQPFMVMMCIVFFRHFPLDKLVYIIKCFTLAYFVSLILGIYTNVPIYGSTAIGQFGGSRGLVYSGNQIALTMSVLAWSNIIIARQRNNSFYVYLSIVGLFLIATKFALISACLIWLVSIFLNSIFLIRSVTLFVLCAGYYLSGTLISYIFNSFSVLVLFNHKLGTDGFFGAFSNNRNDRFDMFTWSIAKTSFADNFEIDFLNIAYAFSYIGLPLYLFLFYRVLKEGRALKLITAPYIFVVLFFFTTGHFTQSVIVIPILAIFILLIGFGQYNTTPSRKAQYPPI